MCISNTHITLLPSVGGELGVNMSGESKYGSLTCDKWSVYGGNGHFHGNQYFLCDDTKSFTE